jgi:hypothetical protein
VCWRARVLAALSCAWCCQPCVYSNRPVAGGRGSGSYGPLCRPRATAVRLVTLVRGGERVPISRGCLLPPPTLPASQPVPTQQQSSIQQPFLTTTQPGQQLNSISSTMSEHGSEERELDLSDDKVVTKYKAAAEICNSECAGSSPIAASTALGPPCASGGRAAPPITRPGCNWDPRASARG